MQEELPVRPSKKPRTLQDRTIVVVTSPKGVLLTQRPEKGLLARLWEPVNLEGHWSRDQVEAKLHSLGLLPQNIKPMMAATHIFSHIQWHMQGFHVETTATTAPEPFHWVQDLSHHSLPSAFREYTKGLEDLLSHRKDFL